MKGRLGAAINTLMAASLTYGYVELAYLKTFGKTGTLGADIAGMAVVDLRNAIIRGGSTVPGYTPYKTSVGWSKVKAARGWSQGNYQATGALLSSLTVLDGKGSQNASMGIDPAMSVAVIPGSKGNILVSTYASSLDKKHMLLALAIKDFTAHKGRAFGEAAVLAFKKRSSASVNKLCATNLRQVTSVDEVRVGVRAAMKRQATSFGYSAEEVNKQLGG